MSDTSLDELHEFARKIGLPRRSFDLDHYDIAEYHHDRAVEAGARAVSGHDLVRALRGSGLRIRKVDRERLKGVRRRDYLRVEWSKIGDRLAIATREPWNALGVELLQRWNEPHRAYHDLRHLEDVLLALDHLATLGEEIAESTLLAAWFHDAVYEGTAGEDERASADLAVSALRRVGVTEALTQEVYEFVVATVSDDVPESMPVALAQLLDADIAIFGSSDTRYAEYRRAVRAEYAQVPYADFRKGRAAILSTYLERDRLYHLDTSVALWEQRARQNLHAEIATLTAA